MALAEPLEPVGAAASRRDDDAFGAQRLDGAVRAFELDADAPAALDQDVAAGGAEAQVDPRLAQVALDARVDLLGALGAQMADRAVDQLEARLDGAAADLLDLLVDACALHVLIRTE